MCWRCSCDYTGFSFPLALDIDVPVHQWGRVCAHKRQRPVERQPQPAVTASLPLVGAAGFEPATSTV
jgi:hypothetical protein